MAPITLPSKPIIATADKRSRLLCITWNIEGARAAVRKSPEIDLMCRADIVFLQETFLSSEDSNLLPQYIWCVSPAIAGLGYRLEKGCAILVRSGIQHRVLTVSESHITVRFESFYGICVYFPPRTEVETIFDSLVERLSELEDNKPVIICGDLNCRLDMGNRGKQLMDSMRNLGFSLENDPTCHTYISTKGKSTIDVVLQNADLVDVESVKLIYSPLRKHQRIMFTVMPVAGVTPLTTGGTRLKRSIDLEKLRASLTTLPPPNLMENFSVDQIEKNLSSVIVSAIPKVGRKTSHHKAWFDKECVMEKQRVLAFKNAALATGQFDCFARQSKRYKALLKTKKEAFDEDCLQKRIDDAQCAPWMLFRTTKVNRPSKIPPNAWETHFSKLYNPHGQLPDIPDVEHLCPAEDFEDPEAWFNATFSPAEVEFLLRRLPNGKAPGPDRICFEHIEKTKELLLPLFVCLLNLCFTTMQIPSGWFESIVKTM